MVDINANARSFLSPMHHAGRHVEEAVVQTEAQNRLRDSGYNQISGVSCAFRDGVLTLRGRVSSFYLKQIAQTLTRAIKGVVMIENHVEVIAPRSH